MASLPYPRTLYKMNMNLHTTLVSSAFFAFCLAASNAAAANNSPAKHLYTSPSQHLTISPSQHLTTSPSHHLNTSPSQHLTTSTSTLTTLRPAPAERLFVSDAVEKKIREIKKRIKENAYLAWMFENCFPNTLDTTVHFTDAEDGKEDTFVYTAHQGRRLMKSIQEGK